MKGTTPIISVVMLLLITISIGGVSWVYFNGHIGTYIEESFSIPPGSAFCTNNVITVVVTNTGTTTLTDSKFIVARIDGTIAAKQLYAKAPKSAGILIEDDNGGAGWPPGRHTLFLSTSSASMSVDIMCS